MMTMTLIAYYCLSHSNS